ncbi:MAG: hypothetical protein M1549_01275 [Candidatus Dependentiae bacterium]|nr:hypothetical protein [Candidatus Dependentiae bacterium]
MNSKLLALVTFFAMSTPIFAVDSAPGASFPPNKSKFSPIFPVLQQNGKNQLIKNINQKFSYNKYLGKHR